MSDQAAPAPEAIDGSPWREPARGGYLDPAGLADPGSEQVGAMLEGRSPEPPLSRLTGMRITAAGDGTATFELPLTDWLCSSLGTISLGPLTVPADAAIACAIISRLPAETGPTTAELSLRMLGPVRPGDTVTARASVIELGSTLAFAGASVTDGDGRLVAHATSLCMLLSLPAAQATRSAPPPALRDQPRGLPDPWQRSAIGAPVPASAWDRLSGLEVMRQQIAGTLPLPPIHHLTGLSLVSAQPGVVTFILPPPSGFALHPPGGSKGVRSRSWPRRPSPGRSRRHCRQAPLRTRST